MAAGGLEAKRKRLRARVKAHAKPPAVETLIRAFRLASVVQDLHAIWNSASDPSPLEELCSADIFIELVSPDGETLRFANPELMRDAGLAWGLDYAIDSYLSGVPLEQVIGERRGK